MKKTSKKSQKLDYKYIVALVLSFIFLAVMHVTNVGEVLAGYVWSG